MQNKKRDNSKSCISVTNHFHAPVGQYIEHAEVVNCPGPRQMAELVRAWTHTTADTAAPTADAAGTTADTAGATADGVPAEFRHFFEQAHAVGWLDDNAQPTLSRPRTAMLADRIGQLLALPMDCRWKPFERLWLRTGMASDFLKAVKSEYYKEFSDLLALHIK